MFSLRIPPESGQESVWDYPRPPRLEKTNKKITVVFGGITIAETFYAKRILETSHPPVYYIPHSDIKTEHLIVTPKASWCEWKGRATYYTVAVGDKQAENAAWGYATPNPTFALIQDHVAFYPHMMEACYVDRELVQPQAGDFYGGWITSDIVGPFKGMPGTMGW